MCHFPSKTSAKPKNAGQILGHVKNSKNFARGVAEYRWMDAAFETDDKWASGACKTSKKGTRVFLLASRVSSSIPFPETEVEKHEELPDACYDRGIPFFGVDGF